MRSSKGGYHEAGHVDQLVNGYRPRLTPRNLVRILAKGQSSTDLIHTESAQVFRSFGHLHAHPRRDRRSSARPLPRPERTAARSARGRQPFKYGTVRGHHAYGKSCGWPAVLPRPERPTERASSKAEGAGPPGGVLASLERFWLASRPPAVLVRGQRQGEEDPTPPTARMQAASRTDGGGRRRVRRP